MAKNPYLMVSLEDSDSKALAQVLSNDTSRALMKHLTQHDKATEGELAKAMKLPLSTVHYNIQNLVKAGLVKATEFHYSAKGKEVLHYTLSNKIIIIAPHKEQRMKLLKKVLPVVVLVGVLATGLGFLKNLFTNVASQVPLLAARGGEVFEEAATDAAPMLAKAPPAPVAATAPIYQSVVFWFVIGAAIALLSYILVDFYLSQRKK